MPSECTPSSPLSGLQFSSPGLGTKHVVGGRVDLQGAGDTVRSLEEAVATERMAREVGACVRRKRLDGTRSSRLRVRQTPRNETRNCKISVFETNDFCTSPSYCQYDHATRYYCARSDAPRRLLQDDVCITELTLGRHCIRDRESHLGGLFTCIRTFDCVLCETCVCTRI